MDLPLKRLGHKRSHPDSKSSAKIDVFTVAQAAVTVVLTTSARVIGRLLSKEVIPQEFKGIGLATTLQ
jgi:hypothetical protein